MTVMLASRPPSLFDEVGGEPTLEEMLCGVWEELIAHRVVRCPVCADEMEPVYAAQALPRGGRCRSCGSALS
jgi:hypothetical protein